MRGPRVERQLGGDVPGQRLCCSSGRRPVDTTPRCSRLTRCRPPVSSWPTRDEQRVGREHVLDRAGARRDGVDHSRPAPFHGVGQVVVSARCRVTRPLRQRHGGELRAAPVPASAQLAARCRSARSRCIDGRRQGGAGDECRLLDVRAAPREEGRSSGRAGGSGVGCCGGRARRAGRVRPGRRRLRSAQARASRARTTRPRRRCRRQCLPPARGSAGRSARGVGSAGKASRPVVRRPAWRLGPRPAGFSGASAWCVGRAGES